MSESLFDIFGEHLMKKNVKSVTRQPISNIENMGKTVSSGPIKPNEPMKKSNEPKKSFLSNTGKALQNTPVRKAFTPRAVNVGALIYTENVSKDSYITFEELEFSKPTYNYDNYHKDIFDYLPMVQPEIVKQQSPPNTPPPTIKRYSMDFDCSYQDEFFTDDFSNESIPLDEDLGLPEIY